MSIRTSVTLDDDVAARVKGESQSRGELRAALPETGKKAHWRTLRIKPTHMGHKPGLNYDNIESLLEYGEGERHR